MDIDEVANIAVCPYCGSRFMMERAGNVGGERGSNALLSLIKAGEAYLRFRDYQEAQKCFQSICKKYPYDFRGYSGLIRAYTCDFSDYDVTYDRLKQLRDLFRRFQKTCDNPSGLEYRYRRYDDVVCSHLNIISIGINDEYSRAIEELRRLMAKCDQLDKQLGEAVEKCRKRQARLKKIDYATRYSYLAIVILAGTWFAAKYYHGSIGVPGLIYWLVMDVAVMVFIAIILHMLTLGWVFALLRMIWSSSDKRRIDAIAGALDGARYEKQLYYYQNVESIKDKDIYGVLGKKIEPIKG